MRQSLSSAALLLTFATICATSTGCQTFRSDGSSRMPDLGAAFDNLKSRAGFSISLMPPQICVGLYSEPGDPLPCEDGDCLADRPISLDVFGK